MIKKPIEPPANTKMIVYLDGKGNVVEVTDQNGNPASKGFSKEEFKKPINLVGHAVLVAPEAETKLTCVIYQFPSGPRKV